MSSIIKAFNTAHEKKLVNHWDKNYVLVDIHATILKPSYHNEEKFEFYPYAKEVLRLLSIKKDYSLILWTSTYHDKIECFDEKTYFDIGIDDKFGFEPETDWEEIFYYLNKK